LLIEIREGGSSFLKFISDSMSTDASNAPEIINVSDGATRVEKGESIKTYRNSFAKAIVPFAFLTVTTCIAHAAPSIDMTGVTSVMLTVQTACLLIGAIIVLISLVFSVFSFAGGNIMRGVTGVAGVLFGGLVIGMGPTWISSLTGQAVG
jgi:hypothetical protein